jgi:hypothetical protein
MYDFSFFVDVVFRILNLTVLIFLLRYLFKKYVLESIKHKIDERHRFVRGLEEHLRAVQHQRDLIVAMIDQESGLSLQVRKRITLWAEAVAIELKMRRREKEQIMRQINAQAVQKEEALLIERAQLEIIPQALEATKKELVREFADPKLSAAVTSRIMAALRKRT